MRPPSRPQVMNGVALLNMIRHVCESFYHGNPVNVKIEWHELDQSLLVEIETQRHAEYEAWCVNHRARTNARLGHRPWGKT